MLGIWRITGFSRAGELFAEQRWSNQKGVLWWHGRAGRGEPRAGPELGEKCCATKSVSYLAPQHACEGKTAFLPSGPARARAQLQQGKCGLLSGESLIREQNRYN